MTIVEAWSGRLSCGHNILCNPGWVTVLPAVGDEALCQRCVVWADLVVVRPLRMNRLRRMVCRQQIATVRRPNVP